MKEVPFASIILLQEVKRPSTHTLPSLAFWPNFNGDAVLNKVKKKSNFCYEQKTFSNQPNSGQRIYRHHPLQMLNSIQVGKMGSALYQVLGSHTTHVKAQWVPYQRHNPMLSYIMGQSPIANIEAGNGQDAFPEDLITAASAWLVSMTLDNMDRRL